MPRRSAWVAVRRTLESFGQGRLALAEQRLRLLDRLGGLLAQPVETGGVIAGQLCVAARRPAAASSLRLLVQLDEDAHLGPQHPGVERLRQVVDGAGGVAAEGLVRLAVDRGQEDDRDVPRPLAALDVRRGLEAVHAGHLHVEQDERDVARRAGA